MSKFERLKDCDLESKPVFIDTERRFDLFLPGQNYVALNIAHQQRKPYFEKPAFRVIGVFETIQKATNALAESRKSGCDGIICKTHSHILLSKKQETDEKSQEKIKAALDSCKKNFENQKQKIHDRVENSKIEVKNANITNDTPVLEGVEEHKEEEGVEEHKEEEGVEEHKEEEGVEEHKEEGVKIPRNHAVRNLDSDPVVISIIGEYTEEPVLVIYGIHKSLEDAKIYTCNTLSSQVDHDISIISSNEWHLSSSFCAHNNNLDNVDYLDKGLSNLMNIPRNNKNKAIELKKYIKESDIITPTPDFQTPQKIIKENKAALELINN